MSEKTGNRERILRGVDFLNYARSNYNVKKTGNNSYRIEPCPVCGHAEHFGIVQKYNEDGEYYYYCYNSLSKCCTGGTILEFMQEVEGKSKDEAYRECLEMLGDEVIKEYNKEPKTGENERQDVSKRIKEYLNSIKGNDKSKATDYLINKRGIDKSIVANMTYFYDAQKDYLCVPLGATLLIQRRLEDTGKMDKINYQGSEALPTLEINEKNSEYIFIVEGFIDGLSIGNDLNGELSSFITLNGIGNAKKLISDLKAKKELYSDTKFILALDNDDPGRKAQKELVSFFEKEELAYSEFKHNENYKDLNEYLLNDNEAFRNSVEKSINDDSCKKPDSIENYYLDQFANDIEAFRNRGAIGTGFFELDKKLDGGLYPGLYVLGAISSIGKTTFVQQITDHIASKGNDVLFFSLEMSKFEMVAKSISRLTFQNTKTRTMSATTREIQKGTGKIEAVNEAIKNYLKIAKSLSIIEGDFDTTIDDIKKKAHKYKRLNKKSPVIVVDYLQILQSDKKDHGTDKVKIDYLVTELKVLSRKIDAPIIVVSSLNRNNYDTTIAFESFKESGNIEYSADVILGLQLKVVNDLDEKKDSSKNNKRDAINKAKEKTPRDIELVCLKNRNGVSYFNLGYQFYPKNNYFMEIRWV